MIVTADLDLSEGGRRPARSETATTVLLFATDDNADLDGALAAIKRCRLIREGHVFAVWIKPALNVTPFTDWRMDEDGEVFR